MHIHCRSCSAPILAEDIDLPRRAAKCRKCQAVFSIADVLEAEGIGLVPVRPKPVEPRPPPHVVVEEWGSDLSVWYRWADWSVLFLLVFSIFWDSFLVAFYGPAVKDWISGAVPNWPSPSLLGHLAVGIGITYWTLCLLLNVTWIQLTGGMLIVRHGPLPTWGNLALDAREIDQLFVAFSSGWQQQGRIRYALMALLVDGTRLELLSLHDQPELLLWLEHALEAKLKIADRFVPGELEW